MGLKIEFCQMAEIMSKFVRQLLEWFFYIPSSVFTSYFNPLRLISTHNYSHSSLHFNLCLPFFYALSLCLVILYMFQTSYIVVQICRHAKREDNTSQNMKRTNDLFVYYTSVFLVLLLIILFWHPIEGFEYFKDNWRKCRNESLGFWREISGVRVPH